MRLHNVASGYFLNSQSVNYGTGSGQQVVTAVGLADSYDSIWTIKESERSPKMCITGEPVLCGDNIRLEHTTTGKNLHSHSQFGSLLTGKQEVSGFGSNGEGDGGDDWIIECQQIPAG